MHAQATVQVGSGVGTKHIDSEVLLREQVRTPSQASGSVEITAKSTA